MDLKNATLICLVLLAVHICLIITMIFIPSESAKALEFLERLLLDGALGLFFVMLYVKQQR